MPVAPVQNLKRLELDERLFSDRRLSRSETHSCNACHDLQTNGASANVRDVTLGGQQMPFNTPTVFNAALSFRLNWEGKFRSLDKHAEAILANSAIMGASPDDVVARLRADPEMARQFYDAYGREPDVAAVLDALAVYQRSLLTPGSPFDRWLAGDTSAITREELEGYRQFKSLGCIACHQGVNVGGNLFQKSGIFSRLTPTPPEVVRVPSLRNVAVTAPYFHDGSAATLQDAVKLMGVAQLDRVLTDKQVAAIVAFLNTLTGAYRGVPIRPATAAVTRP